MTFIISEIGVNWDGDFVLLEEMIAKSKEAGCDAVKFQAYSAEMIKEHPEKDRLIKSAISKNNIEKINEICLSCGIEWFCTPMYEDAVDFLSPYVKRFKIREYDGRLLLKNQTNQLLEKILKSDKEIIVSSYESPKNSKFYTHPKIKWLYCVPKYPCELHEIDFSDLKDFDGFSNHCNKIIAPLSATILGAEIIEIHITSDKTKSFFDNNVSFDYNELKSLVEQIRLAEEIKR